MLGIYTTYVYIYTYTDDGLCVGIPFISRVNDVRFSGCQATGSRGLRHVVHTTKARRFLLYIFPSRRSWNSSARGAILAIKMEGIDPVLAGEVDAGGRVENRWTLALSGAYLMVGDILARVDREMPEAGKITQFNSSTFISGGHTLKSSWQRRSPPPTPRDLPHMFVKLPQIWIWWSVIYRSQHK